MTSIGGAHVEAAVGEMKHALIPHDGADWQVRAGSLAWSCWDTTAHVAHVLAKYASQIVSSAAGPYLPFDLVVRPSPPREALAVVAACGRLLSNAVDHAGPEAVAWHWGLSDPAGFAAMGVGETLVHTHDITQGLGVVWEPPEALSQLVVDRLLSDAPPGRASDVLLWATGRAGLEGHVQTGEWVWRAALP